MRGGFRQGEFHGAHGVRRHRLTPRFRQRSVRMIAMRNARPTRKKNWRRVAASLATLVALLVTPLCAPLCSARMCSQAATATATEGQCHAAASMHDSGPQIHAARNCNPPELVVADVTDGNKNDILRMSRSVQQTASNLATSQEFGLNLAADMKHFSNFQSPPRQSDSLSTASVLRI